MKLSQAVVLGCFLAGFFTTAANAADTAKPLPWQQVIELPESDASKPLPDVSETGWEANGDKEGSLSVSEDTGPWGGKYLRFHVKVDHYNAGQYPQGWPSINYIPNPPRDLSGWDALQFWIRADSTLKKPLLIRFILHSGGTLRVNQELPPFRAGTWQPVRISLRDIPNLAHTSLLHFYLCESDYAHGDEMTFQIGGFSLCNLKKTLSKLPPNEAALALYLGKRADSSDAAVLLELGTKSLPLLQVIETGDALPLRPEDTVRYRFHEVFSGKEQFVSRPLGKAVAAGSIARLSQPLSLAGLKLAPGYYLVTADVRRDSKSLLAGRVGCDDCYVKKPGETPLSVALSLRTGMTEWVRDRLYGDLMVRTHIALPHVYDPLDKASYPQFAKLFAYTTGKHTEGLEAGDTGLIYAAAAYRAMGEPTRARFAEGLLKDSFAHMIRGMQGPDGASITWTNELGDQYGDILGGKGGGSEHFGSYDSNQVGEWLRPIARAVPYFISRPDGKVYARELLKAGRRAADFLAAKTTAETDGIPDVMRHFNIQVKPDGSISRQIYYQEGRRCDVYVGRALAGLSYYAYAMQLAGEKPPEQYWQVMDNTVAWSLKKMKPDSGWLDWQCGDVVEGGCHTFLGNIYIGEGLFGCYLADKKAGRTAAAQEALRGAHLAYRYVTDACTIRGERYTPPLEFWVGPYLYWLFSEYQDAAGKEPVFQQWMDTLHRQWAVDRQWRDFLSRDRDGGERTGTNGALECAILGYLGLREMEAIGKPYHLPQ